jgi:hypothetical protein
MVTPPVIFFFPLSFFLFRAQLVHGRARTPRRALQPGWPGVGLGPMVLTPFLDLTGPSLPCSRSSLGTARCLIFSCSTMDRPPLLAPRLTRPARALAPLLPPLLFLCSTTIKRPSLPLGTPSARAPLLLARH